MVGEEKFLKKICLKKKSRGAESFQRPELRRLPGERLPRQVQGQLRRQRPEPGQPPPPPSSRSGRLPALPQPLPSPLPSLVEKTLTATGTLTTLPPAKAQNRKWDAIFVLGKERFEKKFPKSSLLCAGKNK